MQRAVHGEKVYRSRPKVGKSSKRCKLTMLTTDQSMLYLHDKKPRLYLIQLHLSLIRTYAFTFFLVNSLQQGQLQLQFTQDVIWHPHVTITNSPPRFRLGGDQAVMWATCA